MNQSIHRILLWWGDRRTYWWPLTRLRPAPDVRFPPKVVAFHTLSGLFWAGIPILVLARVWLGRWSPEAFLIPGGVGAVAALVWCLMIRLAWNRRAAELAVRGPAGEPGLLSVERPSRLARWVGAPVLLLAVLLLSAALVTVAENLRGNLALRRFENELRAKGAPVALAQIVPPRVPDEQNLAMLPWLQPALEYEHVPVPRGATNSSIRWRDPEGFKRTQEIFRTEESRPSLHTFLRERARAEFSRTNTAGNRGSAPEIPSDSLRNGRRVDLAIWQEYYRSLPDWPRAAQPQTPAQDVLTALGRNEPQLSEFRAAAAVRPQGQFPLRYEDGCEMLLPNLALIKRIALTFRLRAVALLADNRAEDALADTLLAFRASDLVADEPILISLLVRIACDQLALQPVWEGCLDQRWSDAHLIALQQTLGGRDYLEAFPRAMHGERAGSGVLYDALTRRDFRSNGWIFADGSSGWDPFSSSGETDLAVYLRLTPSGWVRQNQVVHGRYIQALVDDFTGARHHADLSPSGRHLEHWFDRKSPFTLLASMLAPAFDRASDKVYEAEAWRRLALVGLGLERHRLATGRHPEALAALAPHFLAEVPVDAMNGQPLRYSTTADGDYRLYSVGTDHEDNGGQRSSNRARSAADPKRASDLVWR